MAYSMDDRSASLVTAGAVAYDRIVRMESWQDWIAVGRAIEAGRASVMRYLRTNNPQGRVWAEHFGSWLRENGKSEANPGGFAAIDKSVRSKLQSCLDHLPEVEAWRGSIGAAKAQEWQHPATVWRHFSASLKPKAEKPAGEKIARNRDNLTESVERLEQVADLLEAPKQLAFDLTSGEMGAEAAQTFFDVYGAEAGLKSFVQTLHALLIRQDYPEIVRPAQPEAIDKLTAALPVGETFVELKGFRYRVIDGRDVHVQIGASIRGGRTIRKAHWQRVKDARRIGRVLKAAANG